MRWGSKVETFGCQPSSFQIWPSFYSGVLWKCLFTFTHIFQTSYCFFLPSTKPPTPTPPPSSSPFLCQFLSHIPLPPVSLFFCNCDFLSYQTKSNMRAKAQSQNRFMRIITIPIRVLSKARDFYVRSLRDAAERVSCGNAMGCPGAHISTLPKSFSVSSSRSSDGEDVGSLSRSVSASSSSNRVDMNVFLQPPRMGSRAAPRSCSVGMGRIDEDRPCDFEEDSFNVKPDFLYPRSRSYAVTNRGVGFWYLCVDSHIRNSE